MSDKQTIDNEILRRKQLLKTQRPVCPECGESEHIQLKELFAPSIEWKCRACKHKWTEKINNGTTD